MTLLWRGDEPIAICVFTSPALSLSLRNRFFGLTGRWSRTAFRTLNRQLVALSRVVVHPVYRGAGIAARFVRRSCECCGFPWVEALAEMGHVNPFFEKAGFVRVGVTPRREHSRRRHAALYGGRRRGEKGARLTKETSEKSRYARPVYYVFDNRRNEKRRDSPIG